MEVGDGVDSESKSQRRVGLLYDERMCKHSTPDGEPHPENPDRIKVIWNKLRAASIPQRYTYIHTYIHTHVSSSSSVHQISLLLQSSASAVCVDV